MTKSLGDINSIYIATEDICKAQQHSLIDTIFSSANVTTMTQEMMVAYLDATWDKKVNFKNRKSFYNRCVAELEKRGEKQSRKFQKMV